MTKKTEIDFQINYSVTPPQANNLEEVLQLLVQIHEDGFADMKRWLSHRDDDYFSKKSEITLNRHFQYHLNAGRWLGLIAPKRNEVSKEIELAESGNYFIQLDSTERMNFLKTILLKDTIFSTFSEYKGMENSQLSNILVDKIISPNSNWRDSHGNILSLATAKRRASCVIAWGNILGL